MLETLREDGIRDSDSVAGPLFSYVDLGKRGRADHPLRVIRDIVNATLAELSVEFDALNPPFGREPDPTRATTSRADVAGVLFGPFETPTG